MELPDSVLARNLDWDPRYLQTLVEGDNNNNIIIFISLVYMVNII